MNYTLEIQDAQKLVIWYDTNKRSFPWRDTNNPYDVWLSEIMLQQTRIEAVKPKFTLFKETLPTISSLANCPDDVLMRLWEGLGYYSRARNLKKCAIVLCEKYDGHLPQTYQELIALPGIGPYTAGAIASIAFGNVACAVDGNVMRVLSRIFEITDDNRDPKVRKIFEKIIMDLFQKNYDSHFVASFNQGLMELGEVICVPNGSAKCDICPMHEICKAHLHHTTDTIPYRSALNQRKIINRTLLIIRDGDSFLIHKRPSSGLLAGLYEFIGIDKHITKKEVISLLEQHDVHPIHIKALPQSKHIFTHLEWHMHAYEITVAQIEFFVHEDYFLLNQKEIANKAIPSAFKKYVDYYMLRE